MTWKGVLPGPWLAGAVRVSVDTCPTAIDVGLKAAVTPAGSPVMERVATPLNPLLLVIVAARPVDCP